VIIVREASLTSDITFARTIQLTGSADDAAIKFAVVVSVGLDSLLVVVPDVGVDQLGEFLGG
jgi:MFS-type transporter involved in bile tolerance (Atg22 family)